MNLKINEMERRGYIVKEAKNLFLNRAISAQQLW